MALNTYGPYSYGLYSYGPTQLWPYIVMAYTEHRDVRRLGRGDGLAEAGHRLALHVAAGHHRRAAAADGVEGRAELRHALGPRARAEADVFEVVAGEVLLRLRVRDRARGGKKRILSFFCDGRQELARPKLARREFSLFSKTSRRGRRVFG